MKRTQESDPIAEAIAEAPEKVGAYDPYEDIEAIRLDPDAELVSTKPILTLVTVRKPHKTEFVRVHPDPDKSLAAATLELKDEREMFLVVGSARELLAEETRATQLYLTIPRAGSPFLWPVGLPEGMRTNSWNVSAHRAAEVARKQWVRVKAGRGQYETSGADFPIPDPVWPEGMELKDYLRLAFGDDKIITDGDHPAVRYLRGGTL